MPGKRKTSAGQDRAILKMAAEGHKAPAISLKLGVSRGIIRERIAEHRARTRDYGFGRSETAGAKYTDLYRSGLKEGPPLWRLLSRKQLDAVIRIALSNRCETLAHAVAIIVNEHIEENRHEKSTRKDRAQGR